MDQNELTKRVKRTIRHYFDDFEGWGISILGITDIQAGFADNTKQPFDYEITVTLERPGILIGKGGETIEDLTRVLTEELGGKAIIYIHESSLWQNLY